MNERILTVTEAALWLKVPESTVRLWLRNKVIAAKRVGKRWLITETALLDAVKPEVSE